MPVATTKGKLINEALLLLGSGPVASLDDGSDKSTACSELYNGVLLALLTQRTWRFTVEQIALSRLVDTPKGWKYAYQLPPATISGPWVVYSSDKPGTRPTANFQIYGDKLMADYGQIFIDHQVEPTPDKFPPSFRLLVVNALAAAFAVPITEQPELLKHYDLIAFGQPWENRQGGLFRIAAQADAKGKPADQLPVDELVAARLS